MYDCFDFTQKTTNLKISTTQISRHKNSLNENQISSFGLNDMNNLNLLFNSMNQNMTNLSNMQENLIDNGQFKDFCNGNLPPI